MEDETMRDMPYNIIGIDFGEAGGDYSTVMLPLDKTTSSSSNSIAASSISIESIRKALRLIGREPFEEFMSKHGCSPSDGWILIIPQYVAREFKVMPGYVKASLLVSSAMMVNPSLLDRG